MRINNIGYLLKEGIRGIFLHGFMSFAAVCVTVACLIIVGSFSMLAYNLDVMVQDLNKTSEILVLIDSDLSDAEARSIGTKINSLNNVLQATFVSREEALKNFAEDHNDDAVFDGVLPEDLRHRFVVTLEDNTLMEQTDAELQRIPGVAKTDAAYELAEGFSTIQDVLHIASAALIAVLLVISLLIISNTVKLAMYDRRDEIAIMKMVGATNRFIQFPFVVQGFVIGIISAAVAFGVEWLMYDVLVMQINQVDSMQLFQFVSFTDVLWVMVATYAVSGLFVGIFGSLMSIRKFLDV